MRYTKYNIHKGVRKLWSRASKLSFTSLAVAFGLISTSVAVPVITLAAKPPKPPVQSTVVVTPQALTNTPDSSHWFFYNDETDHIDNSLGSFVNGPGTPPLGDGSAQISVTGTQRRNLATYQFGNTKLADITQLKYSTYNPSAGNGGSANRSGYLNFNVDFDGSDTWQKRLVFLPTDNGTVVQNHWNTWDAVNGGNALYRYSGAMWPNSAISGDTPRSLNSLIVAYPNIRTRVSDPWLGVRVGEPYADGYTENIDNFVFGTASKVTTFDFEAVNQPKKNADCNDDGWKAFNAPVFTSEQECKQWVHAFVQGHLWGDNPDQEIEFNANNVPEQAQNQANGKKGKVTYTNNDYHEGGVALHYTTDILCVNSNRTTEEARFMFQIPEGHPSLSGLYVVVQTTKGRHGEPVYRQAVTGDQTTAMQWCQTGQGFAPTEYNTTRGWVKLNS